MPQSCSAHPGYNFLHAILLSRIHNSRSWEREEHLAGVEGPESFFPPVSQIMRRNNTPLGLLVILVMVTAPPEPWHHTHTHIRLTTLHPSMRPYNLLSSCYYCGNRYRPLLPKEAKGRAHCHSKGNMPRSLPSRHHLCLT